MQSFSRLATAILGIAAIGVAQNCTVAPAQQTFSNRQEFAASFFYNLAAHMFDLNAQRPFTLQEVRTWTYDQGQGAPTPNPTQVGNTSVVRVYTCPTTRIGNETNAAAWTLVGTGTLTVVDTNVGESPVVFSPPLAMPAGTYGVAIEYLAPTSGTNPGLLHCLGVSPNPNQPVSDQFLTMTNDGIQGGAPVGTAFGGGVVDSPNLRLIYTPDAASAYYTTLGEGCYFRPFAFYQSFAPGAATPAVANTGQQWLNLTSNYLVAAGSNTIVPPTSTSLTTSPPGSTSSANWDDALSTPITLPFTFNYPGGSTTDITIGSNGCVYLAAVVDNTYDACGAYYGSIVSFRDEAARIVAYSHDLDASVPTAGVHYDVDPANQFVTITWLNCPEWLAAGGGLNNTIQLTLGASGNVSLAFGSLSNTGAGNNALLGFTPGNGSRLGAQVNFVGPLGFQTGDGSIPPVLSMSARPVLGVTTDIITDNITPGTLLQVLAVGTAVLPVPQDLTGIGMPGCLLTINPIITLGGVLNPVTNRFEQPFAVPGSPSLQNAQIVFQAAPLTAGLNPLGIIISNGICARLGQ